MLPKTPNESGPSENHSDFDDKLEEVTNRLSDLPQQVKNADLDLEELVQKDALDSVIKGGFYDQHAVNTVIATNIEQNHEVALITLRHNYEDLEAALKQFKDGQLSKVVIPVYPDQDHFAGFLIIKEDGSFKVIYFDSVGKDIQKDIPDEVNESLVKILEINPEDIIRTANIIQHYEYDHENHEIILTNVHCGAFTGFILTELANQQDIRLINNCLQINIDGDWIDIPDLNEEESALFGEAIRQRDAEILSGEEVSQDPISSLKSIVKNQIQPKAEKDLVDEIDIKKLSLGQEGFLDQEEQKAEDEEYDVVRESDASPDSSDEEFGAKTMMRKVFRHVREIPKRNYKINDSTTTEVTHEEILANPGKYYIANFRGDRLDYFDQNSQRRQYVRDAVNGMVSGQSLAYSSIAVKNIKKKFSDDPQKIEEEIAKLGTPEKLKDRDFIRGYKAPQVFAIKVKEISPEHGNPVISTSKDTEVVPSYADHPKEEAKLHPKYSSTKKPKHRLIGMGTVIIHEASEYINKPKADIEYLRSRKEIGEKSGVERNNQEIMLADEIGGENIAGYVPLVYPNLSKKYNEGERDLFGIGQKALFLTRKEPKTLGDSSKKATVYPLISDLQWRVAERKVKSLNPNGELIWVNREGKFRKFKESEISSQASSSGSQTSSSSAPPPGDIKVSDAKPLAKSKSQNQNKGVS